METEAPKQPLTPTEKLVADCIEQSWQTFGYNYIFDKRALRYTKYVNLLKVFGIGVPGLVGFSFIAHEYFVAILTPIRFVAIFAMGFQFVFSIFAVIYKWDDELAYAYEASQAYNYLYDRFKNLTKYHPEDFNQFLNEYELLSKELIARSQQDGKHNIKDWELRMGMRSTLREHKRPCEGAKSHKCSPIAPVSLESTDCPVCGRFSFKHKILNL